MSWSSSSPLPTPLSTSHCSFCWHAPVQIAASVQVPSQAPLLPLLLPSSHVPVNGAPVLGRCVAAESEKHAAVMFVSVRPDDVHSIRGIASE